MKVKFKIGQELTPSEAMIALALKYTLQKIHGKRLHRFNIDNGRVEFLYRRGNDGTGYWTTPRTTAPMTGYVVHKLPED